MNLHVDRDQLMGALTVTRPAAVSKVGPTSGAIRIEAGKGTVALRAVSQLVDIDSILDADVSEPEAIAVPFEVLNGLITRAAEGRVRFSIEGDQKALVVRSAGTIMRIRPLDLSAWSPLIEPQGVWSEWQEDLLRAVATVTHAAARPTDPNVLLTGVAIDGSHAVATDRVRLAAVELPERVETPVVVPASVIHQVSANVAGPCQFRADSKRAQFRSGSSSWTSSVLEGEFPDWRGAIPTNRPWFMRVQRDELLDALDRSLIVADPILHQVELSPSTEGLAISASSDSGSIVDDISAVCNVSVKVMINGSYLVDAVDACESAQVTLEFDSELLTVVIVDGPLTELLRRIVG